MKKVVFTQKATKPTACYSQAIKTGNLVFLAGVCGDDPATGKIMGDGDTCVETKYALENLKHTVEAAGGTLENIVKVNVYVKDIRMMPAFNSVYAQYFKDNPPARIAMSITDLTGGANLELDAIAVLEGGESMPCLK